jgi:hypothetical protein
LCANDAQKRCEEFAKTINVDAMAYYIELIPRIPYYETALYRPIILLNAQLITIVGQIQGGNEG